MDTNNIKGHLVLVMAPSGSGKTSILGSVRDKFEEIYFAKTFTTRSPRKGIKENPVYKFLSRDEFESMRDNEEFIEWAEYGGNYYGTPKAEITEPMKEGRVVFKEMDLQGVQQIKSLIPSEYRTIIFIDGGDWKDLEKRVRARAPISEEELTLREKRYKEESQHKYEADVVVENHNGKLEEATEHMRQVVGGIVENTK